MSMTELHVHECGLKHGVYVAVDGFTRAGGEHAAGVGGGGHHAERGEAAGGVARGHHQPAQQHRAQPVLILHDLHRLAGNRKPNSHIHIIT